MSSEKYGVNIMKRTHRLSILNLLIVVLLTGCSSQEPEKTTAAGESSAPELAVTATPVTIRDSIEVVMNEAAVRVKYRDKSALYEMEFEYFTETTSYDDYIKNRIIAAAKSDSLSFMEVTDLKLYEHDSALVFLNFHFDGPTGEHHIHPDSVLMYYHNGRWIKTTLSTVKDQLEYEKGQSSNGD